MKLRRLLFSLALVVLGASGSATFIMLREHIRTKSVSIEFIHNQEKNDIAVRFIEGYTESMLVIKKSLGKRLSNNQFDKYLSSLNGAIEGKWGENSLSKVTFFRMSTKMCNSCLQPEFVNLIELQKLNVYLCVLGSFESEIEFKDFCVNYKKNCMVVWLPDLMLDIEVEKLGIPYYFSVNKDFRLEQLLPIDKHNPNLSFEWVLEE